MCQSPPPRARPLYVTYHVVCSLRLIICLGAIQTGTTRSPCTTSVIRRGKLGPCRRKEAFPKLAHSAKRYHYSVSHNFILFFLKGVPATATAAFTFSCCVFRGRPIDDLFGISREMLAVIGVQTFQTREYGCLFYAPAENRYNRPTISAAHKSGTCVACL